MVLASQSPRSSNRWRSMTNERHRRSRTVRRLLILGLIAAVGVGAWAIFLRGGDDPVVDGTGDESIQGFGDEEPLGADAPLTDRRGSAMPEPRAEPVRTAALGRESQRPVIDLGGGSAPAPQTPATRPRSSDETPAAPISSSSPPTASPRTPAVPPAGTPSGTPATAPPATPPPASAPPDASAPSGLPGAGTRRPTSPEPLAAAIALAQRDPVAARRQLTVMATDTRLSPAERAKARDAVGSINREILFSPTIVPNDPFVRQYVIQPGDTLATIAKRERLNTDWLFLKRINGIADERKIKPGQKIKIIDGAFHAQVNKRDYRMDVFLGEGAARVLVASFTVGLGEYNSTPTGRFKVRPKSRLSNPAWTNPRTGEHYRADDPKNPIGEHWIGIQGIDEANQGVEAYGIHGTIEPDSIGRQASMGCVRMHASDVGLVYELLSEPNSMIVIAE